MRLINVHSLEMKEFFDRNAPQYVILSHRWEDEEISYQDFEADKGRRKNSYHKIERLCQIAREKGVDWVWSDTCCIDKRNSTELSEAINSMYRWWYQKSQLCVAYLYDIEDGIDPLGSSTWFTRCWTLQELIAPSTLLFYDKEWRLIGQKRDMGEQLSAITKIDEATLQGVDPRRCSVAQRMPWAAGREATRIEDEAYSLLGLFDVSMPMLYGDGDRAFMTLQERIVQTSDDQSIFAWDSKLDESLQNSGGGASQRLYGLLAPSPAAFASCGEIGPVPRMSEAKKHEFAFTGVGIQLTLLVRHHMVGIYQVALDCMNRSDIDQRRLVIFLQQLEEEGEFARIDTETGSITLMSKEVFNVIIDPGSSKKSLVSFIKKMHIRQHIRSQPMNIYNSIQIQSITFHAVPSFEMKETLIYARDGRVTRYVGEEVSIEMPHGKHGTTAVIVPPPSAFNRCSFLVQYIQIGFDLDFRPFCVVARQIGSKTMIARSIRALHRETTSSCDREGQNAQALLEAIETGIPKLHPIALNVNRDNDHILAQ